MDLQLSTRRVGERAVVEVIGEVDLDTAPQLGEQALAALRDVSSHLVVDLSQVGFMDSTGLKVLLSTQRRAALASGTFALVGATRPVRRILALTGLDQALHVYDSLADVPPVTGSGRTADVPAQGAGGAAGSAAAGAARTAEATAPAPADALSDGAAPTP